MLNTTFPSYDEIPDKLGSLRIGNNEYGLVIATNGFYTLKNFTYGKNQFTFPSSPQTEQWSEDERKIHASLARPKNSEDLEEVRQVKENIAKAWKLVLPILDRYGIINAKIIDHEHIGSGFNSGPEQSKKNIVFYFGKYDTEEKWQKMLSEIEATWKEHGIKPGESIEKDLPIQGSRYFYHGRGKKGGQRIEVEDRTSDDLAGGPFEGIKIVLSSPVKALPPLEARMILSSGKHITIDGMNVRILYRDFDEKGGRINTLENLLQDVGFGGKFRIIPFKGGIAFESRHTNPDEAQLEAKKLQLAIDRRNMQEILGENEFRHISVVDKNNTKKIVGYAVRVDINDLNLSVDMEKAVVGILNRQVDGTTFTARNSFSSGNRLIETRFSSPHDTQKCLKELEKCGFKEATESKPLLPDRPVDLLNDGPDNKKQR